MSLFFSKTLICDDFKGEKHFTFFWSDLSGKENTYVCGPEGEAREEQTMTSYTGKELAPLSRKGNLRGEDFGQGMGGGIFGQGKS